MGGRGVDLLAGGVVATVGAGLFAGLAPAAGLAGPWLPAALVAAAGLGLLAVLSTSDRPLETARLPVRRLVFGLRTLGRLAAAVAVAGTAGAYLTPGSAGGAVALAAVVTVLAVLVPRPPALVVRVAAAVVLVTLALVALACFAIEPVAPAVAVSDGGNVLGVVAAAGLLTVAFLGVAPVPRGARVVDVELPGPNGGTARNSPVGGAPDDSPLDLGVGRAALRAWRCGVLAVFAVVLVASLAVTAGVLRQLGAARLALSPAPVVDALAAADASAVEPLVLVGVAVATGFVLWGIFRGLVVLGRGIPAPRVTVAAGVVTAMGAVLVSPATALVAAAVLLLGDAALHLIAVRHQRLR